MNTQRLLNEFLAEDCEEHVRKMLISEINTYFTTKADVVREFTFNRFNVRLNFQDGSAKIEDELDTSEDGSFSFSLAEFVAALNSHKPQR